MAAPVTTPRTAALARYAAAAEIRHARAVRTHQHAHPIGA